MKMEDHHIVQKLTRRYLIKTKKEVKYMILKLGKKLFGNQENQEKEYGVWDINQVMNIDIYIKHIWKAE